jgi:hypothetical protein
MPGVVTRFFCIQNVRTVSGAYSALYQLGIGVFFSGGKEAGASQSPPSSSEVKNDGTIPAIPIHVHGVVLN